MPELALTARTPEGTWSEEGKLRRSSETYRTHPSAGSKRLAPRNSQGGVSTRRFFRTLSGTRTGCLVERKDNSAWPRGKTNPDQRSAGLADGARAFRARAPGAGSASETARCGQSRGGGDVRTRRGQRR